jgi:SpoVK/Ycf46/Vps4 family AAA+-type ATPase
MAASKNPKDQPGNASPEPEHVVDLTAKEHWKKGNALFEESKFEEAIGEYNEALRIDPKYADAYFNRALTARVTNNFDGAKKDLEMVISLQPKSADAPLLIGDIAENANDLVGAKYWYEKSLSNNPDYTEAKNRLEHIDSLIHMDSDFTGKQGTQQVQVKKEEQKEIIEEGQIKKVAFFKSDVTFMDVIGLDKVKQYLKDNVVLAIKKPDLFKKYGKKLGLGLLLYGPPGTGKCVTEDTLVLLPDGRCEPIKQVVENKEPYVLTLTKMHKLAVKKVEGWWKLEGKQLLRITTARGREVKCTLEHPFLTKGGWVHAIDLAEGTKIGVPRHIPVFGNISMRECDVKLLAYFIAEGGLTQEMPVFTNSDPEIIEDFQSAVRQFDPLLHFNRTGTKQVVTLQVCGRHHSEYVTFRNERSSMQMFLDRYKLPCTNSYDKKIPEIVFGLQKRLLALFLNRLFSGDGWFSIRERTGRLYGNKASRNIGYASNSETLVRQVQHLLLRFGILSGIRKKAGSWELVVYRNRDIDIFIDEIGMFGKKADALAKKKGSWSKIKKKGGNRVVYEEIKSIERLPAPEFVYDLTVEDTHNFVANDFFVHNTYIVRAIAGEAGANVIIARINQIVDMYTGNTEKNLHAIFEQARKNTPCIIFFDELDALGVKRGGGDDAGGGGNSSALRLAVNQFLVEMSGVESNPEGIFVIGATNNPWDIDPALKRSGRFGDSVYIKPPNYKDRVELFRYHTRNKPVGSLNYGRLARATTGYSPADIERIADKAAMLPLLHEYEHNVGREYTMKDVLSILKDKDYSGSSLDEWYAMVKKDVITKTETSVIDGKKQVVVKEGKLDPQEKILYKAMINDIKRNTNPWLIRMKKFIRWLALNLF